MLKGARRDQRQKEKFDKMVEKNIGCLNGAMKINTVRDVKNIDLVQTYNLVAHNRTPNFSPSPTHPSEQSENGDVANSDSEEDDD